MSPEEAWIMVSMMKDVVQRGTAAGSVGAQFHLPAGGKTGTTNDGADVWYIGYTSDLVAGVWMGLDRPKTIKGNAQGGILAAPAWTAFMNEVYRRKPAPPDWPRPEGIITREIDPASGLLAGPGCSGTVTEYFIAGTDPTQQCMPSYGAPVPGDTALGVPTYPPLPTPRPGSQTDTTFARPRATGSPDAIVIPGSTPIPRPSRSTRQPRDSSRAARDTANAFSLPPE
jgi:penicillin-binding protein 1A